MLLTSYVKLQASHYALCKKTRQVLKIRLMIKHFSVDRRGKKQEMLWRHRKKKVVEGRDGTRHGQFIFISLGIRIWIVAPQAPQSSIPSLQYRLIYSPLSKWWAVLGSIGSIFVPIAEAARLVLPRLPTQPFTPERRQDVRNVRNRTNKQLWICMIPICLCSSLK